MVFESDRAVISAAAARLSLSHVTVAVRDLDAMLDFYARVLGFAITNRGKVGEAELAFLSQDSGEHHQIVFVSDTRARIEDAAEFQPMADWQLAFRARLDSESGGESPMDYDVEVIGVVGDSSTSEVHDALIEACPEPEIELLDGEGPSLGTIARD